MKTKKKRTQVLCDKNLSLFMTMLNLCMFCAYKFSHLKHILTSHERKKENILHKPKQQMKMKIETYLACNETKRRKRNQEIEEETFCL